MMMNRHFSSLSHLLIKRSIAIGTFSTIAVLAGWTPNFSAPTARMFDQSAFAQESTFTRYVRAAVKLEQRRQDLANQLQQATGGNVPNRVCSNINQVNSGAQEQVRKLCAQFADSYRGILDEQSLKESEFNSYQGQIGNRGMCERVAQEARRLKIGDISCDDAK